MLGRKPTSDESEDGTAATTDSITELKDQLQEVRGVQERQEEELKALRAEVEQLRTSRPSPKRAGAAGGRTGTGKASQPNGKKVGRKRAAQEATGAEGAGDTTPAAARTTTPAIIRRPGRS